MYLKFLHFSNLKKNSFHGNYLRKYGMLQWVERWVEGQNWKKECNGLKLDGLSNVLVTYFILVNYVDFLSDFTDFWTLKNEVA